MMFGWFTKKIEPLLSTNKPLEVDFANPENLYAYFYEATGINFEHKQSVTTPKLIRFASKYECNSFEEMLNKIKNHHEIMEDLVNTLTVNETYFFREMDQIEFLVKMIVNNPSYYRILCAPGATGEEPYTIAIACAEAGIDLNTVEITSIDINTDAIKKGEEAIYSKRALHRVPESLQSKYFTQDGARFQLTKHIKSRVKFRAANIFNCNSSELGQFDIIFSRNMLIYFDEVKIKSALESLIKLAKPSKTIFFFGHADIVKPIEMLNEFYNNGTKYYMIK